MDGVVNTSFRTNREVTEADSSDILSYCRNRTSGVSLYLSGSGVFLRGHHKDPLSSITSSDVPVSIPAVQSLDFLGKVHDLISLTSGGNTISCQLNSVERLTPSSSGLGHCPFTAEARVRLPLGSLISFNPSRYQIERFLACAIYWVSPASVFGTEAVVACVCCRVILPEVHLSP